MGGASKVQGTPAQAASTSLGADVSSVERPASEAYAHNTANEDILRQLRRFQLTWTKRRPRNVTSLDRNRLSAHSTSSAIKLHRNLAAMNLGFNATQTFRPNSNPRLSPSVLREPATYPPVSQFFLRCETFHPVYSLTIRSAHAASASPAASSFAIGHGSSEAIVTVSDVLYAIQSFLHEPLQTDHWNGLSMDQTRKMTDMFHRRCGAGGMGSDEVMKARGPTIRDWIMTMKVSYVNGLTMSIGDVDGERRDNQCVAGFSFQRSSGRLTKGWSSGYPF